MVRTSASTAERWTSCRERHLVNVTYMGRRISGVVVLSGCLLAYDPAGTDLLQRGIIPALMALAAWGLVQNLAAVALGVAVLGAIHSDFSAPHCLDRLVYPATSLAAGVTVAVIVWRRFQRRIQATHEPRWRNRQPRTPAR